MTYYIQRKAGKDLETVDEFETYKEAKAMVKEYRLSDYSAHAIAKEPALSVKVLGAAVLVACVIMGFLIYIVY